MLLFNNLALNRCSRIQDKYETNEGINKMKGNEAPFLIQKPNKRSDV